MFVASLHLYPVEHPYHSLVVELYRDHLIRLQIVSLVHHYLIHHHHVHDQFYVHLEWVYHLDKIYESKYITTMKKNLIHYFLGSLFTSICFKFWLGR
jgi:hypothetical protein